MSRMIPNVTKQRLENGKIAFGFLVKIVRSATIARMAASSGYHYLTMDFVNTTIGTDDVAQICVACLGAGITPIVRVSDEVGRDAVKIIESGAQGIFVPNVNSAEQAREIVKNCRFPPLGARSSGGSAIQLNWHAMPAVEAAKALDANLLLGINVETLEAVENIEAIAAVEGIDVISVGTNDLTVDMGIGGQFDHPRLLDVYEKVVRAVNRNGKYVRLGNFADPVRLARSVESGARLVTVSNDQKLLLDGMRSGLAAVSQKIPTDLL